MPVPRQVLQSVSFSSSLAFIPPSSLPIALPHLTTNLALGALPPGFVHTLSPEAAWRYLRPGPLPPAAKENLLLLGYLQGPLALERGVPGMVVWAWYAHADGGGGCTRADELVVVDDSTGQALLLPGNFAYDMTAPIASRLGPLP